jgi:flagellar biosynthesis/type III secretory pathway protein FliH
VIRLIHWLLALPEEEELGFRKDVKHMETSMQTKRRSTYERIVWEEGVERGLAQGRDEGRQEGRQEGRREGQLEGRLEGRNTAARELLLDLVRVRFGTCTPSIRARIEAIQDEARLRKLALAVVTVSSLSEFEALAVE